MGNLLLSAKVKLGPIFVNPLTYVGSPLALTLLYRWRRAYFLSISIPLFVRSEVKVPVFLIKASKLFPQWVTRTEKEASGMLVGSRLVIGLNIRELATISSGGDRRVVSAVASRVGRYSIGTLLVLRTLCKATRRGRTSCFPGVVLLTGAISIIMLLVVSRLVISIWGPLFPIVRVVRCLPRVRMFLLAPVDIITLPPVTIGRTVILAPPTVTTHGTRCCLKVVSSFLLVGR